MFGDGGDPHAECGLVDVFDGAGEVEFAAGFAEAGTVLGGCVDGDGEDGGCGEHFLGGEDSSRRYPRSVHLSGARPDGDVECDRAEGERKRAIGGRTASHIPRLAP